MKVLGCRNHVSEWTAAYIIRNLPPTSEELKNVDAPLVTKMEVYMRCLNCGVEKTDIRNSEDPKWFREW